MDAKQRFGIISLIPVDWLVRLFKDFSFKFVFSFKFDYFLLADLLAFALTFASKPTC